MRTNSWLSEKLIEIQEKYFPDITQGNDITVRFGRPAKTRLGSIALKEKKFPKKTMTKFHLRHLTPDQVVSIITINGHFQDEEIPEQVVQGILAHEFCHYVHGFNSLLTKKYSYPHAGGIIDHELRARGLGEIIKFQKQWIRKNWREYIHPVK